MNSTGLEAAGVSTKHLNQIELSRRWSISPRTLERWRWLGEGPAHLKIGGRVVYRLQDIEAFEAAQLRMPTGRGRRDANPSPDDRNA
jgi:hypothetical protein